MAVRESHYLKGAGSIPAPATNEPDYAAEMEALMSGRDALEASLNMPEEIDLLDYEGAMLTFAAYCEAVGSKAYNGNQIPIWDALAADRKNGWIEAYRAAQKYPIRRAES